MKRILLLTLVALAVVVSPIVVNAQDDKIAKITVGYVSDGVDVPNPVEGVKNLNAISASLEPTIWMQKYEGKKGQGVKISGVVYYKRQIHYYANSEENIDTYAAGANFSYRVGANGIFEPWAGLLVGVRYIPNEERAFTDILHAGVDINLGHFGVRTEIGRQRTRSVEAPKGSYVGGGIFFRF